jgi:hypothetical protein
MPTPFQLVLGVAALVGLGVLILHGRRVLGAWLRYRGTRVVVCPENRETVAVEIDARYAAWSVPVGKPELRLEECTRWPEKAGCGQDCLSQIESAPEGCRLRAIVDGWYRSKPCVFCGRAFDEIRWHDRKPALRAPDGSLIDWMAFEPQQVMDILASCKAVCRDCYEAESFRVEHPGLVTDRPRRSGPPPSML